MSWPNIPKLNLPQLAPFTFELRQLILYSADLLVIEPNTPRSEPVKYDKKDGHWYTHDGVDVKDTQLRKGGSHWLINDKECYYTDKPKLPLRILAMDAFDWLFFFLGGGVGGKGL